MSNVFTASRTWHTRNLGAMITYAGKNEPQSIDVFKLPEGGAFVQIIFKGRLYQDTWASFEVFKHWIQRSHNFYGMTYRVYECDG